MDSEWYRSAFGVSCIWCADEFSEYEPDDDSEAERTLCRGHLAEYMGESLASLDKREADERADMANLGYFD